MKQLSLSTKRRKGLAKGFTIIELSIAMIILLIIIGIGYAALADSKEESTQTSGEATAKTINDAILRAKLAGDEDPRIVGETADDIEAAVEYLKSRGYID